MKFDIKTFLHEWKFLLHTNALFAILYPIDKIIHKFSKGNLSLSRGQTTFNLIAPVKIDNERKILLDYPSVIGGLIPIYLYDLYSKYSEFIPREENTVVDVGAHQGIYSLKISKLVAGKGKVLAVEPSEENFKLLIHNLQTSKIFNIIPVKLALSDSHGRKKLFKYSDSLSHSLVFDRNEKEMVKVKSTTLDHLLASLRIEEVDLIKINAEGAEAKILMGARETLDNATNLKIIVVTHSSRLLTKTKKILDSRGFSVKTSDDPTILFANKGDRDEEVQN